MFLFKTTISVFGKDSNVKINEDLKKMVFREKNEQIIFKCQ